MSSRISSLLLLALACGTGAGRADDLLPKAPPATRYTKIAAHSPFAPPTAPVSAQPAATPPPAPGWADTLTATMVMQDGSKYIVTVVDSSNPQHLYLTSEPDKTAQISVASVKWGATREDPPTITLRKGSEVAQVRYESGAAAPAGNNPAGGGPPIPGGARPGMPGAPSAAGLQPFHPPLPNTGQGNPVPSSIALRRPLIRSQPMTAAPAGARPGMAAPNPVGRPNPAAKADDDDDDD